MELQPWLVDGSRATRQELERAMKLAEGVRRFRTPRLFAGWLAAEAAQELSARTDLRFFADVRLAPCLNPHDFWRVYSNNARAPGLNQVLQEIRAPAAWNRATGEEVCIAIVDSGINGTHREFPTWKRAGEWSYDGSDPWTDNLGHGTMCAAIAAASPEGHAELCGVAPDALLYSCKVNYQLSWIIAAYEWIELQHEQRAQAIVVNSSFGYELTTPPLQSGHAPSPDDPLTVVIKRLVAAGIPMVFAAGNNHDVNQPQAIDPNSIWAWNSLPEVLTVAEVDQNRCVRPYSSRGPGEWAAASSPKPDCSAPTFGWVLFGNGYGDAQDGWGTSGASPQAAGLLALLRQQRPDKAPHQLYQRIRDKCQALSQHKYQVGCGMLDCDASLF